jgi:hypothetical protein
MPKINAPLTRRSVLKNLAIAASASSLPVSLISPYAIAETPPDTSTFLSLSSLLTGIKLDSSYLQLGHDILSLLTLNYQFSLQYSSLLLSFENSDVLKDEQSQQLAAQDLANRHYYPVQSIIKAWYLSQVSLTEQDRSNPLVQKLCPNLTKQSEPLITSNEKSVNLQSAIIGQINYDEALTWQACTFTKPSATCGGPFGYWKAAPSQV